MSQSRWFDEGGKHGLEVQSSADVQHTLWLLQGFAE